MRRRVEIPTEDPALALQFCRELARSLSAQDDVGQNITRASVERPTVSIIVPVYNESENIEVLYDRLRAVLSEMQLQYEIVFVNDGSTDDSLEKLSKLAQSNNFVIVIDLARNFGQQIAYTAGLNHCNGSAVITMDADLQDPPDALPLFVKEWRAGAHVVYAVRESRQENLLKRLCYKFFYRALKSITPFNIPLDSGDFCLMDRRIVDLINAMPERNRFIRGIRSWVGLTQVGIPIRRESRHAGKPKYTLRKLIGLASDGLVSFSFVPLRLISLSGLVVSLFSILLAILYAFVRLFWGLQPPGFATLVTMICFFAGIQLITIGVIGEYVGRIFDEVKRRPAYVIRSINSHKSVAGDNP